MERFQKPQDESLYLSELFVREGELTEAEEIDKENTEKEAGPELPPRLKFDTD